MSVGRYFVESSITGGRDLSIDIVFRSKRFSPYLIIPCILLSPLPFC